MARRLCLALLGWLSLPGAAGAQGLPRDNADNLGQPFAQQSSSAAQIQLGQSAVPLYGPWKFHIGDSPLDPKTGKPLWAEPDFDDLQWETVDLTPANRTPDGQIPDDQTIDPNTGLSGYVSGWTAKGHPGYWGYAWYRIRVQVRARPGTELALAGPANVDDGYQFFDNGLLAGHFGDFSGSKPVTYSTQPKMFPIAHSGNRTASAAQVTTGPAAATQAEQIHVLAFRLWMEPITPVMQLDSGGLHTAPVLGQAAAVAAVYQARWLELIRAVAAIPVEALLFGLLAVVAFSLILFDRSDRVYLWMGALFLLLSLSFTSSFVAISTELESSEVNILFVDCILGPLISAAWVMVWRVWFGQHRPAWLPWLTAALTLLMMVLNTLAEEVFFGLIPHAVSTELVTASLIPRVLFFLLLLWVVIQGIRQQGIEGWLVLPLVVLRGINAFRFQLRLLHIPTSWYAFGAQIVLSDISNLLVAVVIALLLLRRLLQSMRRQRELALDVKHAQEVQRVILPEAYVALPGLEIESVYRPARDVGGDFFQIIPHPTDGSLLLIAGDVAGKGLQAGMLVALLIGAIRMAVEISQNPEFILKALNRRLMGRGNAAATCLALRIDSQGAATLANSGHLPPWLNGRELAVEGSLPLGITEWAEPSVMQFQLRPKDKLTLISDGILEATDQSGQLFGFDRIQSLLASPTTAGTLADAAQSFGQNDDISVITLTRTATLHPA
jgi:hypothetical protein